MDKREKAKINMLLVGVAVAKLTCYGVIVYLITKTGYTPLYWEFWVIILLIPSIEILGSLTDEFKDK